MYDKEIKHTNTNNGYLYFCDSMHPLSDINGRVYLHRHLASLKLNRWLSSEEHVHHVDGNKLNNCHSNLEVLTRSQHAKLHKENTLEEKICKSCAKLFKPTSSKDTFCTRKCSANNQVKDKNITKELLDSLIPKMSWVALGNMFGYTDTGIKKRAKALGCNVSRKKNNNCV